MSSRAEIEAILPKAAEEVYSLTGVQPRGLGITAKSGSLALAVTLHERPHQPCPESVLGVPVVFRIVEPPMFLKQTRRRARA